MRKFNVTGLCTPEEDYMVNLSGKVAQISKLIESRSYFTINRARQYGKTTILLALERALKDKYIIASISFEGLGDEAFSSEKAFCGAFIKHVTNACRNSGAPDDFIAQWNQPTVASFDALSDHISDMCTSRDVVLMIDEVDKAGDNRVFLHFLGMLRNKFLARKSNKDATFYSVILAGVYDIKNIKLKMIRDGSYIPGDAEGAVYNSPWNIAVSFDVDMSFCPEEIASMLAEYENDHHTGMDIAAVSGEIYYFTGGYPFLVSRICQCIDEEPGGDRVMGSGWTTGDVRATGDDRAMGGDRAMGSGWTTGGIRRAVQKLLGETNTLFDDIFKNIENNAELSEMLYDLLIRGDVQPYVAYDSTVSIGLRYGFITSAGDSGKLVIANKIFEALITNYFVSIDLRRRRRHTGVLQNDLLSDGRFDMALCLRKFAEHYAVIYNELDAQFLERNGRLLFLSYLKPLINGQGFYHIESQFTDARRMDLVVDFGRQQFIIELKIWRGEQYQHEAYEQLCSYLDSKNAAEGYLLTFDFRKEGRKVQSAEWLEADGKRIFSVIV